LARVDDYANAFKLAAKELSERNISEVAQLSGTSHDTDTGRLHLDFIGKPHQITLNNIDVLGPDGQEAPLTEKVVILHYLNTANGAEVRDDPITFREVPSGEFYYSAFVKRAENPLLSVFGHNPDLLLKTAPLIGGDPIQGQGDAAVKFLPLPKVPVSIILWGGDEEFDPSAQILFDRSIQHYLPTEDIAWLSGMIVYRLMRLAAKK
jgi:hypothetical protein